MPPLFSKIAHDEPTTWIPTPLKFPPNQPQHSNYNNSTFCFPATRFPIYYNIRQNSDTNSHISVLYSISQLNNPNIESPDEFADSVPSISTPSYASQITPTYSSFHSDRSSNSPDLSQELDNFITLQQQPFHLDTPTINQISSTTESSNPPTPTLAYTASLAPIHTHRIIK